jgi:tetratricopeptide (TPR) repeat protein
MAVVDPYAPCPCGSGQKFKWCCQKVEAYAARAERFYDGGQVDAALQALDEGLRKVPNNTWLLTRKALILEQEERAAEAKPLLERVVGAHPTHLGAQALLTRVVLETDGPVVGAAQFQKVLAASPPEGRGVLAGIAQLVGLLLNQEGHVPAAIRHLHLAEEFGAEDEPMVTAALRSIERNPEVSPWLKHPYELSPAPEGPDDATRQRFDQALEAADQGLWGSAASIFEDLIGSVDADAARNAGLCRLWLADEAAAVADLRRSIPRLSETEEAVDLEALCHLIAPLGADDLIERVQLIWPVKDRETLFSALQRDARLVHEGDAPTDPNDPDSVQSDQFALLDRPRPGPGQMASRAEDLPVVVGRVLLGREIVALDLVDDGRLDALKDQFTEVAGPNIAPAHPRTKVLGAMAREAATFQTEWLLPPGIDRPEIDRLQRENRSRVLREVWPGTPMSYLGGRTPRQAARAGDARVALRAALCQMELSGSDWEDAGEIDALRAEFGLDPEPPIDPETVRIDLVHLARLHRIPADRLDDDRLIALYLRARTYDLILALERSARALSDRPALLEKGTIDRFTVFADLATLTFVRKGPAEAFEWVDRGRRTEPSALRPATAPRWDMLEVRLRSQTEAPEAWVPQLAVVLDRYQEDPAANTLILTNLMEMGLVQMVPVPDRPEGVMLDSRRLMTLLTHYGPRVTTAAGDLGIAATKGEIWTPGGPSSSGAGGIWTPGSASPAGGDRPKLIVPGR